MWWTHDSWIGDCPAGWNAPRVSVDDPGVTCLDAQWCVGGNVVWQKLYPREKSGD